MIKATATYQIICQSLPEFVGKDESGVLATAKQVMVVWVFTKVNSEEHKHARWTACQFGNMDSTEMPYQ